MQSLSERSDLENVFDFSFPMSFSIIVISRTEGHKMILRKRLMIYFPQFINSSAFIHLYNMVMITEIIKIGGSLLIVMLDY